MDAQDSTRGDGRLPPMVLSDRDRIPRLPGAVLQSVTNELVRRLANDRTDVSCGHQSLLQEPEPGEIDHFCDALISPDIARSTNAFDEMRNNGKTPDTLALRYIASAAQRLGKRWETDDCSFLEVTLGTSRLHGLQRSMRSDFHSANLNQAPELTALFTVTPGDTHSLGVTMAADFFRRAGWTIDLNTSPEIETLLAQASLTSFSVIGISVGAYPDDGRLEETAARLRGLQPGARLVLGGRVADIEPELLDRIAADSIIDDVTTAPFLLRRFVISALND